MQYTEMVERSITGAPFEYNRDVRKMLSTSELMGALNDYQKYRENFLAQLELVRERYCNGRLGFAIICLLHKKYIVSDKDLSVFGEEDPSDKNYIIFRVVTGTQRKRVHEYRVHADNTQSPETFEKHAGDVDIYAGLLNRISVQRGRITANQARSVEGRFRELLSRDFGKKESYNESREKILKGCYYLGWNASDFDYLALRWGDDGLCANCVEDQIWRFLLDVPVANLETREELFNTYQAEKETVQSTGRDEKNITTNISYTSLKGIIANDKTAYEDKLHKYAAKLAEYQVVYERYSATARDVFEHILLYTARELGWKSSVLKRDDKHILRCKVPPLTTENQERLVLAVLSGPATTDEDFLAENNNIRFPYQLTQLRIAYPVVDEKNNEIRRTDGLGRRFLHLLRGRERITKNDIIYGMFLLTVFSSRSGENPVTDYNQFRKMCDTILERLQYPGFYPCHVLEYACGKALLAGEKREEAFWDVTHTFSSVTAESVSSSKNQNWADPVIKIAGERELPKSFSSFKRDLKKAMKGGSVEGAPDALGEEILSIGNALFTIWQESGFCAFQLTILSGSRQIQIKLRDAATFCLGAISEKLETFLHDVDTKPSALSDFFLETEQGEPKSILEIASAYEVADGEVNALRAKLSQKITRDFELDSWSLQGDDFSAESIQKTGIKLPDCVMKTVEAYDRLGRRCENLGGFLLNEPEWNRRCRRMVFLHALEGFLLKQYDYAEMENKVNRLKRPAGANLEKTVKTGFKKPIVDVKDSCILAFDHMDKQDVEFYLTEKRLGGGARTANDKKTAEKEAAPVENAEPETQQFREKKIAEPDSSRKEIRKVAQEDLPEEETDSVKWINEARYRNDDGLRQYIREINRYRKLDENEERILVQRMAAGDEEAGNDLVCANLRLVAYIARKQAELCRTPILDLIQSGNEGMMEALTKFRSDKNVRFSTYAYYWVKAYMQDEQRKDSLIQVPRNVYRGMAKINRFKADFYMEHERLPSDSEIAGKLGLSINKLHEIVSLGSAVLSLDAGVSDDDNTTFVDLTEDSFDLERITANKLLAEALTKSDILTPREQEVIRLHYGMIVEDMEEEHATFAGIAKLLKIPVIDVIIAELTALRKLRSV